MVYTVFEQLPNFQWEEYQIGVQCLSNSACLYNAWSECHSDTAIENFHVTTFTMMFEGICYVQPSTL